MFKMLIINVSIESHRETLTSRDERQDATYINYLGCGSHNLHLKRSPGKPPAVKHITRIPHILRPSAKSWNIINDAVLEINASVIPLEIFPLVPSLQLSGSPKMTRNWGGYPGFTEKNIITSVLFPHLTTRGLSNACHNIMRN